jgi:hypothetical protein
MARAVSVNQVTVVAFGMSMFFLGLFMGSEDLGLLEEIPEIAEEMVGPPVPHEPLVRPHHVGDGEPELPVSPVVGDLAFASDQPWPETRDEIRHMVNHNRLQMEDGCLIHDPWHCRLISWTEADLREIVRDG